MYVLYTILSILKMYILYIIIGSRRIIWNKKKTSNKERRGFLFIPRRKELFLLLNPEHLMSKDRLHGSILLHPSK